MKKLFTTLIVLLAVAFNLQAQNVFISPETGHLIAAVTYQEETGFENGFSALWRHDQLGLSMVVADDANLTDGGEIANPAGNLNTVNGKLTLTGGQTADCFVVVSLPKGYRFTGYTLTLNNDMNNHQYADNFETNGVWKQFYETGKGFDYNNPKAYTGRMGASNDSRDYTISRSASSKTDMGNRLYFRLHKDPNSNNSYYGVSIKSFVIYFAADADFDQPLQALPFSTPVGVTKASFMVGKPELGTIKPNTKNGKTYYSYNYRNVDDLEADNLLYQASAVKGGKADDSSTSSKTITRTINKDGLTTAQVWYALSKGATDDDNTYYVETPVTLTSASNKEFPTGYRITGAKLEFGFGQQDPGGYTIGVNRHGEITYLHSDATFGSTNPETGWQLSGRTLSLNGNSVYVRSAGSYGNTYYYITTQRPSRWTSPSSFYVDERNRIYTSISGTRMYVHEGATAGERAVLSADTEHAAQLISYSSFTPSGNGFTATVYDKTGNNVFKSTNINSSNNNETIEITGLNNDAVKFKISGLSDGAQALVRITLTMEHLNPYIHSMDVVGRDANDSSQEPLTQNFTADNFNVRGGHFEFNVPKGTGTHTWNFEFDNLTSNYTDATYASSNYKGATDGTARVAFVESNYFKANEDLYQSNPDYTPVSDKLQVITVGTVPFRFNNADQLSNTTESEFESQLEEYPFSVARYKENSGYTDKNGNIIPGNFQQLQLHAGQENIAYIIVADETRYNIAPTTATQHRYYAHYAMDIELQEKEYEMTVTPVKVYDKTFYTNEYNITKEHSMWGVKISTTETNGYAHLTDIIDTLVNICAEKKFAGLDTCKQILYVDLSDLQSIVVPSMGGADYVFNLIEMMADNCLVYLPNSSAYKVNNSAHRSEANSQTFTANANIILDDKKPFYAPYDITVPNTSYAKYTREITNAQNGKANITTLVLPFQFTINEYGEHTNSGTGSDGKTFNVYKLDNNNAISSEQGFIPDGFSRDDLVGYDEYIHFDTYRNTTGYSEAYKPYLVYIKPDNQLEGDENFTVMQYGANVIATTNANTATVSNGVEIIDESNKATGTLDNQSFTLTPAATMSGCKLDKNSERSLYFAANRFRDSKTLVAAYPYVYIAPFRGWFNFEGTTSSKYNVFGVAFGNSGETTGIDNIEDEKAEKLGTYKFIRNGQLYIHTDNGVFTVDGRKVNL